MFDLPRFEPGTLEAVGLIGGKAVAPHRVGTPGSPVRIEPVVDDVGVKAGAGESDLLFAHARWLGAQGNLCIQEMGETAFVFEGAVEIIGPAKLAAEAGIALILVRVPAGTKSFQLTASAFGMSLAPARQNWSA